MQGDPCFWSTDDMPLNETDKAWVRETIREAHKSHGISRLTAFLKNWSGVGASVAILIFALTQWSAYVEFRTKTGDRLDQIDKTVDQIEDDLRTLKNIYSPLMDTIGDPASARKQKPEQVAFRFKQAKYIVTTAIKSGVPTDPRLIDAATTDTQNILRTVPLPESVKEDGKLLLVRLDAYRAVTNDILDGEQGNIISGVNFDGNGKELGAIAVADLKVISDMVFFGATISGFGKQNLTAIRWVDATFKDDTLVYNGGPLYLDSVRFIKCKYNFGSDANSQRALQTIQSSGENPVTLIISGAEIRVR